MAETVKVEFPPKLKFLFEPHRYKVAYGGRGGAKSWGFARALLIQGTQSPLLIVCCREIQKSIEDSVYRLLSNQIDALGLKWFYKVEASRIIQRVGSDGKPLADGDARTEFVFAGLRHNVDNIKSLEGADRVWVEEAHTVSKNSWDKLVPTVRKDGSEIWVSFNPELEQDETYQRFVLSPPRSAHVEYLTWRDNPWFPPVLEEERLALEAKNEDDYLHVWEGKTLQHLEGAIYAEELRRAEAEGRITQVPYLEGKPVHVFADLGFADFTSLWFMQKAGFEYHFFDFYQDQFKGWPHYLAECQRRGYLVHTFWLPHDSEHDHLSASKSVAGQTREAGYKVHVGKSFPGSVESGIKAARDAFPQCWFDREKCADGLMNLRHYRFEQNARGQYMKTPLHDHNSHAADAFREFALSFSDGPGIASESKRIAAKLVSPERVNVPDLAGHGWMGG